MISDSETLFDGRPVRIALVHPVFANNMGYANTIIPKILARHGAHVDYLTTTQSLYPELQNQKETYGRFLKSVGAVGETRRVDGYDVHVLGHRHGRGGVVYHGLSRKIRELKPDIVQTFNHAAVYSLELALLRLRHSFAFFTGNHTTASVYPLAQRASRPWEPLRIREFLLRGLPGRLTSTQIELCHGATDDCSDVAVRFLGVPESKISTIPLGVDTDIFHPSQTEAEAAEALALRTSLGVAPDEILCVYTGRFADAKNPVLLARAVETLRKSGKRYRAVFFGEGVQRAAIEACEGSIVREFVPYTQLGTLYRAADIGVWPTQESTSMIDAAACGIPIIVNDTIVATERVDGNGITYRLNDQGDLERALLALEPAERRRELGTFGARKMHERYGWETLVAMRLAQYRAALAKRNGKAG